LVQGLTIEVVVPIKKWFIDGKGVPGINRNCVIGKAQRNVKLRLTSISTHEVIVFKWQSEYPGSLLLLPMGL